MAEHVARQRQYDYRAVSFSCLLNLIICLKRFFMDFIHLSQAEVRVWDCSYLNLHIKSWASQSLCLKSFDCDSQNSSCNMGHEPCSCIWHKEDLYNVLVRLPWSMMSCMLHSLVVSYQHWSKFVSCTSIAMAALSFLRSIHGCLLVSAHILLCQAWCNVCLSRTLKILHGQISEWKAILSNRSNYRW